MLSAYTQLSKAYNHCEFFSVVKLLKNLAYYTQYNTRYPVLKLLKAVSRRLLINEFEAIFFAYVVRVNKWNIHDEIIRRYISGVRDIVCYSADDDDYKAITLYLLLCGYTVKYYLNENIDMYTAEMERVVPDFRQVFEEWAKQYAMTTLKIHPKNLNKIYRQICLRPEGPRIQADYNSLVDQLLQISPSYNPEKEKLEYGALKREYAEIREVKDKKENHKQPRMSETVANLDILCRSAFLQQINPAGANSLIISSVAPKKRMPNLGSSLYGMWAGSPADDEIVTDIRDVTLGITQGHSDSEGDAEPAPRKLVKEDDNAAESGFLLRKNVSSLSDYLFKG